MASVRLASPISAAAAAALLTVLIYAVLVPTELVSVPLGSAAAATDYSVLRFWRESNALSEAEAEAVLNPAAREGAIRAALLCASRVLANVTWGTHDGTGGAAQTDSVAGRENVVSVRRFGTGTLEESTLSPSEAALVAGGALCRAFLSPLPPGPTGPPLAPPPAPALVVVRSRRGVGGSVGEGDPSAVLRAALLSSEYFPVGSGGAVCAAGRGPARSRRIVASAQLAAPPLPPALTATPLEAATLTAVCTETVQIDAAVWAAPGEGHEAVGVFFTAPSLAALLSTHVEQQPLGGAGVGGATTPPLPPTVFGDVLRHAGLAGHLSAAAALARPGTPIRVDATVTNPAGGISFVLLAFAAGAACAFTLHFSVHAAVNPDAEVPQHLALSDFLPRGANEKAAGAGRLWRGAAAPAPRGDAAGQYRFPSSDRGFSSDGDDGANAPSEDIRDIPFGPALRHRDSDSDSDSDDDGGGGGGGGSEGSESSGGFDAPERSTIANADDIRFSCAIDAPEAVATILAARAGRGSAGVADEAAAQQLAAALHAELVRAEGAAAVQVVDGATILAAFTGASHADSALRAAAMVRSVAGQFGGSEVRVVLVSSDDHACGGSVGCSGAAVASHGTDVQARSTVGPAVDAARALIDLFAPSAAVPVLANDACSWQSSPGGALCLTNGVLAQLSGAMQREQLTLLALPPVVLCPTETAQGLTRTFEVVSATESPHLRGDEHPLGAINNALAGLEAAMRQPTTARGASVAEALQLLAECGHTALTTLTQGAAPPTIRRYAAAVAAYAQRALAEQAQPQRAHRDAPPTATFVAWEYFTDAELRPEAADTASSSAPAVRSIAVGLPRACDSEQLQADLERALQLKAERAAAREKRRAARREEKAQKRREETVNNNSSNLFALVAEEDGAGEGGFSLFDFVAVSDSDDEADLDGLDGSQEEPRQFTDTRGNVWRRSGRALGRGAFGKVYVGMGEDGALVAIKGIPIMRVDERECRVAVREVALLTRLRHENIVEYVGGAIVGGYLMVVMEAMGGGSLHFLACQHARFAELWLKRYLRDILEGLAYLHAHGVLHRDVKPHNVLLSTDGRCKLADFGTAAFLGSQTLRHGDVGGTPIYMAPEACLGAPNTHSDVWSVGIMAYQLATGEVPWHHGDAQNPHVILHKLGRDPAFLPTLHGLPDGALKQFIALCLHPDPDQRPSASALLRHPYLADDTPATSSPLAPNA